MGHYKISCPMLNKKKSPAACLQAISQQFLQNICKYTPENIIMELLDIYILFIYRNACCETDVRSRKLLCCLHKHT